MTHLLVFVDRFRLRIQLMDTKIAACSGNSIKAKVRVIISVHPVYIDSPDGVSADNISSGDISFDSK